MSSNFGADLLQEKLFQQIIAPDLQNLYTNAVEQLEITATDILTIRDISSLTGYFDKTFHCLMLLLFSTLREGSICLPIEVSILENKLALIITNPEKITKSIITNITTYSNAISIVEDQGDSTILNSNKPLLLYKNKSMDLLYFQKYFYFERTLENQLKRLLNLPCNEDILKHMDVLLQEILVNQPATLGGKAISFNKEQITAMALSIYNNFVIISGGPGTGKTTIVLSIIRLFLRNECNIDKIKIAAPTGKAAQRLTEALHEGTKSIKPENTIDKSILNLSGTTLHRLLEYRKDLQGFNYCKINPLSVDLLIIDEISMVDVEMMAHTLSAVPDSCTVVFLGDRNQLPSVSAGSILADILPENIEPLYTPEIENLIEKHSSDYKRKIPIGKNEILKNRMVLLTQNYRSVKEINEISQQILASNEMWIDSLSSIDYGKTIDHKDIFTKLPPEGLHFFDLFRDTKSVGIIFKSLIQEWGEHIFIREGKEKSSFIDRVKILSNKSDHSQPQESALIRSLLDDINSSRILSPMRAGPFGLNTINLILGDYIAHHCDPHSTGIVFSGSPIIIQQNDYTSGLFNGDTGIILKTINGTYTAYFIQGGILKSYPVATLPSFDLSFGITIHKSQGTEYDNVLCVIAPGTTERLLSKEIMYTALTRSKKRCILLSNKEVLKETAKRKINRFSALQHLTN